MNYMVILLLFIAGTVTAQSEVENTWKSVKVSVIIDVSKNDMLMRTEKFCFYRRINLKRMAAMLDARIQQNQTHSNESITSLPQISATRLGNWSRDEIYETALVSNLKLWSRIGGVRVEFMTRKFRKRPEFFTHCENTKILKMLSKEFLQSSKTSRCSNSKCNKSLEWDYYGNLAFYKYNCLLTCFLE